MHGVLRGSQILVCILFCDSGVVALDACTLFIRQQSVCFFPARNGIFNLLTYEQSRKSASENLSILKNWFSRKIHDTNADNALIDWRVDLLMYVSTHRRRRTYWCFLLVNRRIIITDNDCCRCGRWLVWPILDDVSNDLHHRWIRLFSGINETFPWLFSHWHTVVPSSKTFCLSFNG